MLATQTQILTARSDEEIARCFPVIQELRLQLKNREAFVAQVQRQIKEGYQLAYLLDGAEVGACIGFRALETLAWGKYLYIDDLITREKSRKKGLGKQLLQYAIEEARLMKCVQVHLDSGHHRFDAHRLYLKTGFILSCHHLALFL